MNFQGKVATDPVGLIAFDDDLEVSNPVIGPALDGAASPLEQKAKRKCKPSAAKRTNGKGSGPASPSSPSSQETQDQSEESAASQTFARASGPSSSLPPQEEQEQKKETNSTDRFGKGEEMSRADLLPVRSPPARRGLPLEVKHFIVESFAVFKTHSYIIDAVAKHWGIRLDARTLCAYDPTHRYCRIGPKLLELYEAVREQYTKESANVAIAHQAHRLRLIGTIVEKATTSRDYNAALKGLELAAKEMGGTLEGKTVVEHRGAVSHVHGTVEDARQELAMRLASVVEGGLLLPHHVANDAAADTHAPPTPQAPPA